MPRRNKEEVTKKHKEIKLDKRKIAFLVTFILIFIIILCFLKYKELGLIINKKITDKDVVSIELLSKNNTIYSYKNEVLVYNLGNLTTYDRYGKKTWSEELQSVVDADINIAGDYIQIVNKDKGYIYVYKNKYETSRIKIDGTIKSAYINDGGYSVVEYIMTGSKTVLGIYDKSGKSKYNVKLGQEVVGKYILTSNCRYLAYVNINLKGISVSLDINVIDLKNSTKDDFKSSTVCTKDNELVYQMYVQSNDLICRTDNSIIKYSLSGKKFEEFKIEEDNLVYIDLSKNKYSFVKTLETGAYAFGINSFNKKDTDLKQIQEIPKYFEYVDGITYVSYQKKIDVYNGFKNKIKEYDSDMVITKPVVFNNGNSVAILLSNRLVMFTI